MRRFLELFAVVAKFVKRTTSPTRKPTVIHDPVLPTIVLVVVVIEVGPPEVASVTISAAAQVPWNTAS